MHMHNPLAPVPADATDLADRAGAAANSPRQGLFLQPQRGCYNVVVTRKGNAVHGVLEATLDASLRLHIPERRFLLIGVAQ
eukprot:SAG31_NODE_7130_length_1781_cov_1.620690_2_plen_81_part_00